MTTALSPTWTSSTEWQGGGAPVDETDEGGGSYESGGGGCDAGFGILALLSAVFAARRQS
ncbi:hypothetical protein FACS1894204_06590 [Synergistales bacterium]|nr:hypothetical protein FACS1894204_06590 [Synergistales bacterium]